MTQNLIHQTLKDQAACDWLVRLVAGTEFESRAALSRRVSEDYADFLHSVNDTIIEIEAGERTKDFDITIIDDGAAESGETITIKWTKGAGRPGTPGVLNFTGTITDNDGGTATAPAIVTDETACG